MARRPTNEEAYHREQIETQRRRYYEACQAGMSHDEATKYANDPTGKAAAPVISTPAPPPKETGKTGVDDAARRKIEIPSDWRDLPYVPKAKGGACLKSLATSIEGKCANKEDAFQIIETELKARAAAAGKNADAEINDDWQALPLEKAIALASNFTDEELTTEADVERVIQTELARRAG